MAVALLVASSTWGVSWAAGGPSPLPAPLLVMAVLLCPFAGGLLYGRRGGRVGEGASIGLAAALLHLLAGIGVGAAAAATPLFVPIRLTLSALVAAGGTALGRRLAAVTSVVARPVGDAGSLLAATAAANLVLMLVARPLAAGRSDAPVEWWRWVAGDAGGPPFVPFGLLAVAATAALGWSLATGESERALRLVPWFLLAVMTAQLILSQVAAGTPALLPSLASAHPLPLRLAVDAAVLYLLIAVLSAVAVMRSPSWQARVRSRDPWGPVAPLAVVLAAVLIAQLTLGIALRPHRQLLIAHMLLGAAVVLPLGVRLGIAVLLTPPARTRVGRLGITLLLGVVLQVALGALAFAVPHLLIGLPRRGHSFLGAALLVVTVVVICWAVDSRLRRPTAPATGVPGLETVAEQRPGGE